MSEEKPTQQKVIMLLVCWGRDDSGQVSDIP